MASHAHGDRSPDGDAAPAASDKPEAKTKTPQVSDAAKAAQESYARNNRPRRKPRISKEKS